MDDILRAQQNLGKSLGKARAGEDKELSGKVREAGEAMAQMLAGILKMSKVHAADNRAFDMPVSEFVKSLQALDGLVGAVHLVTVDELAYLNDMRLRTEGKAGIKDLGAELKKHNVGGLSFHAPLDAKQTRLLVSALADKPKEPTPRTALREKLHELGLKSIELHGIFRFRTSEEKAGAKPLGDASKPEVRVAAEAQAKPGAKAKKPVAAEAAPVVAAPAPAGPPKLVAQAGAAAGDDFFKTMVGSGSPVSDAADAAFESQAASAGALVEAEVEPLLEPEAIEEPVPEVSDDPNAATPAIFSVLERLATLSTAAWDALATGRTFSPLPLRRAVAELLELGVEQPAVWDAWVTGVTLGHHAVTVTLHALLLGQAAGLPRAVLQDLGVAALVHDIGYAALVGKPQGAGPEGLLRHPGEGVRLLLQQRGFSQAKVRRLRAVLEHHRPQGAPEKPSVLGAILHIAEDYATFLRVAGGKTTAVHVLGAMAQDQGQVYHPVLMQVFVNALGQFPPGALLERADGSRVRSICPVRRPEQFMLPLVRPVGPDGKPTGGPMELAGGPAVARAWPG